MSRTVVSSRTGRAVALAALVALLVLGPAGAAFAVEAGSEGAVAEEDHSAATIEDIGADNEVAEKYLPEPAELPLFQRWMYVPLFAVGVIVILMLVFRYLQWQPRFAEERRSKRRR